MKKNTRWLAACMCTLLLVGAATSCGDASAEQTPVETQGQTETQVEVETVDPTQAALDAAVAKLNGLDFSGYEFRVMDRSDEYNADWETIDVWAEAEDGDTITDAVFKRNRILEEAMNIKISENKVKLPYDSAKKAVMAGTDDFDVFTDGLSHLATIAVGGYLTDLTTMDTLQLSNEWWDQDLNRDLTIANKLFFCTGDISIMDNYGTWCVMFNKDIAQNYDLDNLYELVKDGKWTMQVMYDMAKEVTKDIDGNGTLDDTDQWGYLTESYNQYGLWASGGQRITAKDKDDLPVLTAFSDKSVEVIQLVTQFTQDKSCTLLADNVKTGDGGCAFTNEHFGGGKALFIYGGMWLITKYRAYDVNFGVVPSPKYDESQDRYYNTYSYANCTAYSVPTTASDLGRTGTIMEAMAEVSKYTLTPAYYDVALKGKFIRDEESAEMLDIILAQRAYDLGMIFNWGSMFSTITGMSTSKNPDFASLYAKNEKSTNKAIEKFIDALESLE
ncbi:MAG: carbohydrate ABC transporter substrate-binding protein [Clostridia bacterium]|nr:carbohydrate ABC transporter substrate-binding protein [Clostridia bacterium]